MAECPEYAYQLWSEEQIRAYFEQDGANVDALPKPAACLSAEEAVNMAHLWRALAARQPFSQDVYCE